MQGKNVNIAVDANDLDGTISDVCFYIDNAGKSSSTNFPYNYNWNTTFENLGTHSIKATCFDNSGNSTTDEVSVFIGHGGSLPVADFTATATPTSGTAPLTVNFTDQSTNTPTSWQWDFGDGGTSTQQNPTHTYNESGTYTVILSVSNSYGTDEKTKTDFITVNNGGGGTPPTGYFTDSRDGQVYAYIVIGNQTWMAENLKYLPSVSPSSNKSVSSPYYYVNDYEGDNISEAKATTNYQMYGVLYNWPASVSACPAGWHVPSDEEWKTLEMALGMSQSEADIEWGWRGTDEGKKMKSKSGWINNGNGTNSSGFNALPGGLRLTTSTNGSFGGLGYYGYWWSSTENSGSHAWHRYLNSDHVQVHRGTYYKACGLSVRCLKN